MKKLLLIFAAMVTSICANAFEFDSIDLSLPYSKVVQEIAKRGYTYNNDRNCLEGNCQGVNIYLSINYLDVKKPGYLGQLIVDVPAEGNQKEALPHVLTLLNVLYHHVPDTEGNVYSVDSDGTTLEVKFTEGYYHLIYNTPYYKAPKK